MTTQQVWILGCGYTASRVARRLLSQDVRLGVTTRDPSRLAELARRGADVRPFDATQPDSLDSLSRWVQPGAIVLLSIPSLRLDGSMADPTPQIVGALEDRPSRVVYLSTTGVYGNAREVDESTPAAPVTHRQRLRVEAEQAVSSGPWSTLILRPAAIYGPGRGVHAAMREGTFRLAGDGLNYVSRIQVDDLASHALAALFSGHKGAYPAADDLPARSREIAEFCADLLHVAMPPSVPADAVSKTRSSDRQVDGKAIRRLLGIELLYPSYREGIPAALAEETTG